MLFIFLGAQMQFGDVLNLLPAAIVLSALVLIGNPLILMALMGWLGYRRKTSLQTGFTVAQISEFSLILVALGVSLGHVKPEVLSLVTLVGLVTIFGSTYLLLYSHTIYRVLAPYLGLFERAGARESQPHQKRYPIVLFGCGRLGYDFLETLSYAGKDFLVVEYDPITNADLKRRGVAHEFGDAGDVDFLESLELSGTELVISTIPDSETNLLIHRAVKAKSPGAIVMVLAHRIKDALSHYDEGVDYVILPHFLGGKYAAELVVKFKDKKSHYKKLRREHIESLKLRIALGHEHPSPAPVRV